MLKVINVVGARPNFMKMAPIIEAMNRYPDHFQHLLVHTGQHYDDRMSGSFFTDLGMPKPDIDLEVGSGSHAEQTARVMVEFEKVCLRQQARSRHRRGRCEFHDWHARLPRRSLASAWRTWRQGCGRATWRCRKRSTVSARMCCATICSRPITLPTRTLKAEGVPPEKVFFVGNVMIDTLLKHRALARGLGLTERLGLEPGPYATLTLHRPSNVDDQPTLRGILEALEEVAREIPIVFPIHPRTKKMIEQFGLARHLSNTQKPTGLWITEPLGYLDFLPPQHARTDGDY